VKILVAERPASVQHDDVCSAISGEIVIAPFACLDDECHCHRAHQGVVTYGYSSVAVVRDADLSADRLVAARQAVVAAAGANQWLAIRQSWELVTELIEGMCQTAARYPPAPNCE
jgi:hypothetical protein